MAVGREICNINKSYIISCTPNNWQSTQEKQICEGDKKTVMTKPQYSRSNKATVQLF
jgi:hypothetical protein